MSKRGLNRKSLMAAFDALSSELASQEVRGELFVVGGAAMALAYSARRVTRVVDAIFEPKAVIYQAALVVAERLELPDDWLHDAVKSFAPGEDSGRRVVFSTPSLEVSVASPRYLLAMKLLASRVDQDADDIRVLYEQCGFTSAGEGMDLLEEVYPRYRLEPRTQFLLEEMFPARQATQTD